MAVELLSRVANWQVCEQTEDVRGWKVVDAAGESLGVVRDLMINTETGEVDRVVLDNRAEYPVRDLTMTGGDTLRLRSDFITDTAGVGAAPEPATVLRIRCERR
jgi:sporulation protein YlmC with PRC-barrel domain